MKIMVARNWNTYQGRQVETYSSSMVRVLKNKGHDIIDVQKNPNMDYSGVDYLLDIDCGRNTKGQLIWQAQEGKLPVKSAVLFIDTHGYPTLHKRLAPNYDHVFFAVWDKRDLFTSHPSAHWCPNFTDLAWFNGINYDEPEDYIHFGFFGSKCGLNRAEPLIEIAQKHNWTTDVRQIVVGHKHRWPATAEAMSRCWNLFNHGQKHDGPNLRVMESMLMLKPLICDQDSRSGLDKLFEPWVHYIPYQYDYSGLEEAMKFTMKNMSESCQIAANAYEEVRKNHLVENRINQILEVIQC